MRRVNTVLYLAGKPLSAGSPVTLLKNRKIRQKLFFARGVNFPDNADKVPADDIAHPVLTHDFGAGNHLSFLIRRSQILKKQISHSLPRLSPYAVVPRPLSLFYRNKCRAALIELPPILSGNPAIPFFPLWPVGIKQFSPEKKRSIAALRV